MSKPDTPIFTLDPIPKVITFDCYGTLVQWHEVLLDEIQNILTTQSASRVSASAVLNSFSLHGRHLMSQKPHRLYKDILRLGFVAAFCEHGLTLNEDEIERIALSPTKMGPHSEVPNALHLLRQRYKLAVFTNSDDKLIAPTVASIGVPFDYVITAEQAQAYKPSRRLFEYAYNTMSVLPNETVHVAIGMYSDMKACHELGVRGIWVNRRNETGNRDWLPYTEVQDLDGVLALLKSN